MMRVSFLLNFERATATPASNKHHHHHHREVRQVDDHHHREVRQVGAACHRVL